MIAMQGPNQPLPRHVSGVIHEKAFRDRPQRLRDILAALNREKIFNPIGVCLLHSRCSVCIILSANHAVGRPVTVLIVTHNKYFTKV
jgi:predicted MarR family transcription regulator